jgi:hypothetical protein
MPFILDLKGEDMLNKFTMCNLHEFVFCPGVVVLVRMVFSTQPLVSLFNILLRSMSGHYGGVESQYYTSES